MSERSANFDRAATFMRDLAEIISPQLHAGLGLPKERSAELGMDCSEKVCEQFSGELIYVPQGLSIRITERDRAM